MMIKYLVMDVDGTLTDGKIYMGAHGEMMKAFNIKDGCGIHDIAIPGGIIPVIITGRTSEIVKNAAESLEYSKYTRESRIKLNSLIALQMICLRLRISEMISTIFPV